MGGYTWCYFYMHPVIKGVGFIEAHAPFKTSSFIGRKGKLVNYKQDIPM